MSYRHLSRPCRGQAGPRGHAFEGFVPAVPTHDRVGTALKGHSRTEGRSSLLSSLGEVLWYLSGSDRLKHIEYYIPEYRSLINASSRAVRGPGAYGPRLFGDGDHSQMAKLLRIMKEKSLRIRDKPSFKSSINRICDLGMGTYPVPLRLGAAAAKRQEPS